MLIAPMAIIIGKQIVQIETPADLMAVNSELLFILVKVKIAPNKKIKGKNSKAKKGTL